MNGLTQQLAHELGGMGIRVNAIAPGPDRHRGDPHPGRRRRQGAGQGARAQADGPARGHGRRLPVPALRRGGVGDRADHRRRRRTDVPLMTASASSGSATSASRWRCGSRRRRLEPAAVYDVAPEPVAELVAAGATARRQRGRAGRRGRRALRDGARRRPGARRARPRRSAPRARRSSWSSTRRSRPDPPAELAGAAACTASVVDAPVSGGPMGAADGTLAIMVGGAEAAYAAARAGAGADGLAGRARRPARRRHPDEAGPQPDPLRRVHRGDRGAAARRGGRARPGRARRGGPAHRRDHRRAGRDHAPRHHGAAGRGRLLVRRLRPRPGAGGEGPRRSRSSWPTHWASTYRSRSSRAGAAREGTGTR